MGYDNPIEHEQHANEAEVGRRFILDAFAKSNRQEEGLPSPVIGVEYTVVKVGDTNCFWFTFDEGVDGMEFISFDSGDKVTWIDEKTYEESTSFMDETGYRSLSYEFEQVPVMYRGQQCYALTTIKNG